MKEIIGKSRLKLAANLDSINAATETNNGRPNFSSYLLINSSMGSKVS